MGPWMLCLWFMAHFILEGEGWKMNCNLICRKVLICKPLISTSQITILIMDLKKIRSVGGPCASTRHTLRVFKDCACSKILCVLQIELPPSSSLFYIASTSFTIMTFTVFLRWLQKWKPARFKSVDIVVHAFGALWPTLLFWIVVNFRNFLRVMVQWGATPPSWMTYIFLTL